MNESKLRRSQSEILKEVGLDATIAKKTFTKRYYTNLAIAFAAGLAFAAVVGFENWKIGGFGLIASLVLAMQLSSEKVKLTFTSAGIVEKLSRETTHTIAFDSIARCQVRITRGHAGTYVILAIVPSDGSPMFEYTSSLLVESFVAFAQQVCERLGNQDGVATLEKV